EGGVAEAVVGGALVGILEHLVGLVDLLEAGLAALVAGVAVGMPFHGELAECGLQVAVAGLALDLQNLVVAAFRHARRPTRRVCRSVVAGPYLVTHFVSKKMALFQKRWLGHKCKTRGTRAPRVSILSVGSHRRTGLGPASGRFLVLLVVVDLGE